jgi:hypothetical protein
MKWDQDLPLPLFDKPTYNCSNVRLSGLKYNKPDVRGRLDARKNDSLSGGQQYHEENLSTLPDLPEAIRASDATAAIKSRVSAIHRSG